MGFISFTDVEEFYNESYNLFLDEIISYIQENNNEIEESELYNYIDEGLASSIVKKRKLASIGSPKAYGSFKNLEKIKKTKLKDKIFKLTDTLKRAEGNVLNKPNISAAQKAEKINKLKEFYLKSINNLKKKL